jgi:hypothetical protein
VTWVVVGLLVLVVALLAFIAWRLDTGLGWIAELIRASGQANVRCHGENGAKLDEIEKHAARSAKPFYEADAERQRQMRENPDYHWDHDRSF